MLSRYTRLASPQPTSRPPAMDVDSREVPAEQGPEKISPVERLPTHPKPASQELKRSSFWKRIALPFKQKDPREAQDPVAAPAPLSLEPVLNRILALEKQLSANQSATEIRLEQVEENLTRLWETQDELAQTELRERLAVLQANQEEIADALHTTGRNLILLTSTVAAALAGGVLAVVFLL